MQDSSDVVEVDNRQVGLGACSVWLTAFPTARGEVMMPRFGSSIRFDEGTETSEVGLDFIIVRIVGLPLFPRLALLTRLASSCWSFWGYPSSLESSSRYAPRMSESAGPEPQLDGIARLDAMEARVCRGSDESSGIGETEDLRARILRALGGATRPAVRRRGSGEGTG